MTKFAPKKNIGARTICCLVALVVVVVSVFSAINSFGQTITYDISPTRLGSSNTYYSYDASSRTLTISGTGATPDFYTSSSSIPWYEWDNETIENLVVESGITDLGDFMFYQLGALNYSLPVGLKSIGKYTFSYNNNMTEIEIPYGVTMLDYNSFASNSRLEHISLPSSLKTIGQKAFYGCTRLDNVVIPCSVKSINVYAFQRCTTLSSITFESLTQSTTINNYAFQDCSSLKTLTVPMHTSLGVRGFGYDSSANKYDDLLMRVYKDTSAYNYAVGNEIAYELLDNAPITIDEGVANYNVYKEDNIDTVYHYSFTPKASGVYNAYSTGNCDLLGRLYDDDGVLLAENDDIADSNRNFCLSVNLQAGKTYDLCVSSIKMLGSYNVYIISNDISQIECEFGKINATVDDSKLVNKKRIFTFSDTKLSALIFKYTFGNGDIMYANYQPFFAGYYFVSSDNQEQEPYVCGDGVAHMILNENEVEYPYFLQHGYEDRVVPPTEDENGYTEHTCVICGDCYEDTEVETNSYIVTGKCVLGENPYGKHDEDIPYSHAVITCGKREYSINEDGTWRIRTFKNCYITFNNIYGSNLTVYINVDSNGGSYDYGTVVLDGYDMNRDGYVNAKDYVVFYKHLRDELGDDYWRYGAEYLIKHRKWG